jgi:hypothetical protein
VIKDLNKNMQKRCEDHFFRVQNKNMATVQNSDMGAILSPLDTESRNYVWFWGTGRPFPGGEADHSPPSNVEVKTVWSQTSTPKYVFMMWYRGKRREKFTFILKDCIFCELHSL